ncbi:RagB/SusD family nutrient uptake outer membrane protein [Pedobacter aquatilis]|uniref:RagB/SusD family nutrient uptake outer membrane protein n=1 Tax=Pedobacter aquatilis TaxID=351343 RepID=UPI00292CC8E9|nr:RagB/SusD family nutrient uptake outer membrane protein [Pedobacter aquatilis]
MKNTYFFFTCICVLFSCLSCKKYLDAKSNLRLVTPQNLRDLQGILDDHEQMNIWTTPSLGEGSADDYFLLPASYTSSSIFYKNLYRWLAVEFRFGNDWDIGYHAIYNANLTLDLLESVDRDGNNGSAWDNVKGSALFFRAFYMLGLTTDYAKVYNESTAGNDLGIVLRLNSDFNVPSVRASVRESYDRLIADVTQALPLLPQYPQHVLRPSKGAAYALLARAYLFMGKYKEALANAKEALIINNQLMDYNGDASISSLSAAVPFKKFNAETIFYTEMNVGNLVHTTARARIDTSLVASYHPSDLRRSAYFNNLAGYQQYKGSYAASNSIYFSGLATDELYLISAECNAALGAVDDALKDVNFLLGKRWDKSKTFIPIGGNTKEEVLQNVRLERRKELLMRGLRWIDIKRYNREGANIIPTRKIDQEVFRLMPDSRYYALPLPDGVIQQTGMPQN